MTVRKINGVTVDADTLDGDQLATIEATMDSKIDAVFQVARKSSDQNINNTETLANITEMLLAVGATEVWVIHLILRVISISATPDLDYAFTVPSGGAMQGMELWDYNAVSPLMDLTSEQNPNVDTVEQYLQIMATYVGGGTAGNLQLQAAQHTATEENTTVKTNSVMICHRIA